MRLVIFSDLHLDTPFQWAEPAVARRRRQGLRDTLVRVVRLADEVGADAILAGGDLYEHDRVTPDTAAFLRETLGSAGRPVLVAPGNHDWLGPRSVYVQTAWPANVVVFSEDRLTPHPLTEGLTVWGGAHRAPANTDGFLDGFRVDRGGVHVALFHGSEQDLLRFEPEGKTPHAPFAARQVPEAGLHHAFLGHYHRPRDGDWVTYPGNPDPLVFGEDGERGAVVADVSADGAILRERRMVASTAAHDVRVDVTGCASLHDVREAAAKGLAGLDGVARLTLEGELAPQVDLAARDLDDLPHDLEAVVVRFGSLHVAYDVTAIADEATVRGQFVRDVLAAPDLDEGERQRVLVTGLRALEGRQDLDPPGGADSGPGAGPTLGPPGGGPLQNAPAVEEDAR